MLVSGIRETSGIIELGQDSETEMRKSIKNAISYKRALPFHRVPWLHISIQISGANENDNHLYCLHLLQEKADIYFHSPPSVLNTNQEEFWPNSLHK